MATETDPLADVRMDALKQANKVRVGRARLKQQLKEGRDPVRVLRRPPASARGMRIEEFLRALPLIGRKRANRILDDARTSPERTLETLAFWQREAIIRGLQDKEAE